MKNHRIVPLRVSLKILGTLHAVDLTIVDRLTSSLTSSRYQFADRVKTI